jgi:hypothetical protein
VNAKKNTEPGGEGKAVSEYLTRQTYLLMNDSPEKMKVDSMEAGELT